jgi:beta-N-acetylhexosaminidase
MALDLRSSAARLLIVGFHGRSLEPDLERLIERGVGGVIFFSRNIGAPAEVTELSAAIKRRAARPLLTSVDQEGGNVVRLREGFTPIPAMRAVGRADDAELSFELGRMIGQELAAVGFDLNFAPVLDVDTNPDNPVIGPRSFGRAQETVAWHALALMAGLGSAGVAACGKHFPGHGDTLQDSHHDLPRLEHSLERLESVELVPFRAAVKAGIPALMTAHVMFRELDPELPATMSALIVRAILRNKLGYEGLVVSDDLEMKAIVDHYSFEDVLVRGLNAGVDAFLCCHSPEKMNDAIDIIATAVARGHVPVYRFEQAVERMSTFASRWAAPPIERFDPSSLGTPEHRAVIERLVRRAGASASVPPPDPTVMVERKFREF